MFVRIFTIMAFFGTLYPEPSEIFEEGDILCKFSGKLMRYSPKEA